MRNYKRNMHAITAIVQQHDILFVFIFLPGLFKKADSELTEREIGKSINTEMKSIFNDRSTLHDEKRIQRILDALPLTQSFNNYVVEVKNLLLANKIKCIFLELAKDIAKYIHENAFNLNARGHRKVSEKMLKELKDNLIL